MNWTHIIKTTTGEFIPELIINGKDIIKAEFTPGAAFKIEQYRDGLVITLSANEAEIERLLLEVDTHPHTGADWIRDNGELYLAGTG
ncbi:MULTISPECIES: hypothetical protein [unclassified Serratia (in: enterobacteria)]|uniref:hypothetical protein n=1 Tax=unclassified Serratia (in: enterobacteria) TaxID=2647522 RepID=UPI000B13A859|nr:MULTISPECIES: hypothetical protein [unclassified Serratia (in: enterobacteria)]